MLISRTHKSKFITYKNKINIFENIHKKLILIIIFLFFTSFYLLAKTTNIFTESKLYYLNKILINNGFIIKNIEILGSLSWYQPLKAQDEYTYHYDQENNLSLYLNIYESRYLHLNLKAFVGQLDFDETITEFIDEDRRVKNSEINYFDHPNMGLIIKIDKS